MFIAALQTARKNSKSVPNKNILEHDGKPFYLHNINYAQKSKYVQDVYVSTDSEFIINGADKNKYKVIDRPGYLATDTASHQETIMHGINHIEAEHGKELDIVVVLLGNNVGAFTEDLDTSIEQLQSDKSLDSVISVSEYNMFNPFRAYQINNNRLETVLPQGFIASKKNEHNVNDKKSAGDIYFYNGSFWVCRKAAIVDNNGLLPFPWLGNKIRPFIQKDIMEVDATWQLKCV